MPAEPHLPQGWIHNLELPLGMHLRRVVHDGRLSAATLQPMSCVAHALPESVLFVQTTHRGRGVLQDHHLGARLDHAPGVGIFQRVDRVDHQHWADPSMPVEVTALGIGESALHQLLGEAHTRALFDALGLGQASSARTHLLPPPVIALLQAAFAPDLAGHLRALHAQARVLDFLVALVGHSSAPDEVQPRTLRLIRQLRSELDPWQDPATSLEAFAQLHHLSKLAISSAFKREYGQSLHAYITELRLNAAHSTLQAGKQPLKVLAARLGYATVSHFSHAFTRRFGYRPGNVPQSSA